MNVLFIQAVLKHDYDRVTYLFSIVGFMWLILFVAILVDLQAGIRKARQNGEVRTSFGLRASIDKVNSYYSMMIIGFLGDCIGMFVYNLPFATMLCTLMLVFIEGYSIFEKAQDKQKRRMLKGAAELATLIEKKDNIVPALKDLIEKIEENEQNNKKLHMEGDNSEQYSQN